MKKGYLYIEAALFLPVFLIGILSIGSMISFLAIQERAMDAFSAASADLARDAYAIKETEEEWGAGKSFLLRTMESQKFSIYLDESQMKKMKGAHLSQWVMGKGDGLQKECILTTLEYDYALPFSIRFTNDPRCDQTLKFRLFTGSYAQEEPMGFSQMTMADENGTVWVFPDYGEHYHTADCRTICVYPRQLILTEGVKCSYGSCSACCPESLKEGSVVYCFPEGDVYHRESCKHVKKYVIEIEKSQAEREGYTPCQICGG